MSDILQTETVVALQKLTISKRMLTVLAAFANYLQPPVNGMLTKSVGVSKMSELSSEEMNIDTEVERIDFHWDPKKQEWFVTLDSRLLAKIDL